VNPGRFTKSSFVKLTEKHRAGGRLAVRLLSPHWTPRHLSRPHWPSRQLSRPHWPPRHLSRPHWRNMPSRQERRKAERDAAKRAGAEAAATARANNVNVEPLGDLKTQANDPYAWPSGYCLARHVIGLNSRNDISSAVNDVASDVCLTRPLGAGRYARFRGHCAEGCPGRTMLTNARRGTHHATSTFFFSLQF